MNQRLIQHLQIIPELLIYILGDKPSDYFILRTLGVSKRLQDLLNIRYKSMILCKDLLMVHHRYEFKVMEENIQKLLFHFTIFKARLNLVPRMCLMINGEMPSKYVIMDNIEFKKYLATFEN